LPHWLQGNKCQSLCTAAVAAAVVTSLQLAINAVAAAAPALPCYLVK
jgi:hypothetical protein